MNRRLPAFLTDPFLCDSSPLFISPVTSSPPKDRHQQHQAQSSQTAGLDTWTMHRAVWSSLELSRLLLGLLGKVGMVHRFKRKDAIGHLVLVSVQMDKV